MHTVKRLAITLLEVTVEVILMGLLLGGLSVNQSEPIMYIVMGSILALPVMLFLHGYYVTRIVAGIIARKAGRMVYPAIASALFVIHMYVTFVRMKPGLNAFGTAIGPPFIVGGACFVFPCAVAGDWLLRKWTSLGRSPPPESGSHGRPAQPRRRLRPPW
jgi:hypothetical protein